MTWRPIRTAPKDATPVILAVPSDHGPNGWAIGEARYIGDVGDGYSGWWWAGQDPGDYYGERVTVADYPPTKWKPMPAPPPKRRKAV